VFVGIREGGFIGGLADAEMNQLAQTTAQAVANLAQRISVSELADSIETNCVQQPNLWRTVLHCFL